MDFLYFGVNASVVLPLSSFGGRPLLPDLLSVSEFCIISLVFGLNMPCGKKLCKSQCSALNSSASKKCTTCGITFDKRGIVVSIASFFYLGCGCLLVKKRKTEKDKIWITFTFSTTLWSTKPHCL